MSKDTIYRENAIRAIDRRICELQNNPSFKRKNADIDLYGAKTLIMELPSADRPQGEWIDKGDYAECSNCGADSGTQFNGIEPVPRKTKFCPNCGARMKGADND